jgi:hypothetical protein
VWSWFQRCLILLILNLVDNKSCLLLLWPQLIHLHVITPVVVHIRFLRLLSLHSTLHLLLLHVCCQGHGAHLLLKVIVDLLHGHCLFTAGNFRRPSAG